MASTVTLRRQATKDVVNLFIRSIIKYQIFSEDYLCQRFGLKDGDIQSLTRITGESEYPPGSLVPFTRDGEKRLWTLRGGCSYDVLAKDDVILLSPSTERGKAPMEVMDLSDDSEDEDDFQMLSPSPSRLCSWDSPRKELPEITPAQVLHSPPPVVRESSLSEIPQSIAKEGSGDETLKMFRVSALEAVLAVQGRSEIFKFIKSRSFVTKQVRCLPRSYNGDIIFELPPFLGDAKRGDRLHAMERGKDCYYWTRIFPTSAVVPKKGKKELWEFGKVCCTGALECRNDNCEYFNREGSRNASAWNGNYKISSVHKVGEAVEDGGLLCGFCQERPYCIASCPAMMFYMYPAISLPSGISHEHMSRLAIHQGLHVHPPRRTFSREAVEKVERLIEKHYEANPSATPSRIKNVTIGDLMSFFHPGSSDGLTKEDEQELWESLQVISTPQKFTALLRSVRKDGKDWKGNGIFDSLRRMQQNSIFPYIQRYRVPGQGSETDFPFVFKMSVKGPGSGIDILSRMRPGRNLHGTWVMFDVMRRITTGWLTFSAHVYDHHYRALCTIFTCELMAEDAPSCEIAWNAMLDVGRQYGIDDVYIHGFMADNAIGGWNAVRKVFFGGVRDPEKERSDAFHWEQALHLHTEEAIPVGKRAEHKTLWRKLRDAKNVVEAYKISNVITDWWKAGNCYADKLRILQGWLAWWVVRWTQWGNYLRSSLSVKESALMLNTTGAESVHAAMRKCLPQRKVGIIEACEMDQNRAAAQIAAYASYRNGTNCGKGPTLFELAFRAADMEGSPSKFIDATNLWVESSAKFDLSRTGPLPGDVRTKSQKRKGPASANITPHDSHRPDRIQVTTPNHRGTWRRNLHSTDFGAMPADLGRSSSVPCAGDDNVLETPPSRPVTRSWRPPFSAPPVLQSSGVGEIEVPTGTWHLRRTSSGRHKGPQCNGTCGNRTHRTDCRNHIKSVGYRADTSNIGVVGIAIDAYSLIRGVAVPSLLWFCPNNICHRSRARKCVSGLSPVPVILQVQRGTHISNEEKHFLASTGLDFVGRPPLGGSHPEMSSLRIDVNLYPEHVQIDDLLLRLQFRNKKKIRQRMTITSENLKAIEKAEREPMRIISERDVMEGNGFGRQYCIRSHEGDDTMATAEYWVQICCFPTCSCDDYWSHHYFKQSFLTCKHLFWIFRFVLRLDIRTNLLPIQPVLTVGEVKYLLERASDIE